MIYRIIIFILYAIQGGQKMSLIINIVAVCFIVYGLINIKKIGIYKMRGEILNENFSNKR